jgi:hypothetical protein
MPTRIASRPKAAKPAATVSSSTLYTIFLTILICAVSTVSGYLQYDNTIRELYNKNGYVIGNIIESEEKIIIE